MELDDRIIIFQTSERTVSFVVDAVRGVEEFSRDRILEAQQIFPGIEFFIEGVGKIDGETVLVCALDRICSSEEIKDWS